MSDPIDWRHLREFAGVAIDKSFVLSWQLERSTLSVDLDVYLTPEHAFYEKPRPAEKVCIRPAILEFPCCDRITLTGARGAASNAQLVTQLGTGAIHGLCRYDDGPYEISGVFGTVLIDAERPVLRLRGP